jgi:hypothetical protein
MEKIYYTPTAIADVEMNELELGKKYLIIAKVNGGKYLPLCNEKGDYFFYDFEYDNYYDKDDITHILLPVVLPVNTEVEDEQILIVLREFISLRNPAKASEIFVKEIRKLFSTSKGIVPSENLFENLFKQHQEFSINKFPDSTPESSLIGLKREADEAIQELEGINRDYDGNALPLEYVDCFMYLLDSIGRAGISFDKIKEAFIQKLEINKNREWIKNKDNSYSHKK